VGTSVIEEEVKEIEEGFGLLIHDLPAPAKPKELTEEAVKVWKA